MGAAVVSLIAWSSRALQRAIAVAGTAAALANAILLLVKVWSEGIQAVQIGNWPAPFGITIVADMFSAIMVTVAATIGLAAAVYSLAMTDSQHESFGYYPLLHILLMGVSGAFMAGDLFNL
jgi:multicomponent Na+:H+ antiporter subunit D